MEGETERRAGGMVPGRADSETEPTGRPGRANRRKRPAREGASQGKITTPSGRRCQTDTTRTTVWSSDGFTIKFLNNYGGAVVNCKAILKNNSLLKFK